MATFIVCGVNVCTLRYTETAIYTTRGQDRAVRFFVQNIPMTDTILPSSKQCAYCEQLKPLADFRRRTGKRSKAHARRGACRDCRKQRAAESGATPLSLQPPVPSLSRQPEPSTAAVATPSLPEVTQGVPKKAGASPLARSRAERAKERKSAASLPAAKPAAKGRPRGAEPRRAPLQHRGPKPEPTDTTALVPSSQGMILMRGHSDKGRRWHQEIDLELAVTLVKEHAAVVVNRRTIRRLYSNKAFRSLILNRDRYTCYFCGLYGDTIDHLLPRAKGGHTTPDNCVCACNLCNQTKADKDVEEFMRRTR
ncbi:HNH endonuclease [Paenibacillus sp. NPDC058177]|uniref:HNH endonuclease n=1 Tax=Paenibacillus sp. NPDC058177 TaxID=3346369 RepID=UPI0036D81E4C